MKCFGRFFSTFVIMSRDGVRVRTIHRFFLNNSRAYSNDYGTRIQQVYSSYFCLNTCLNPLCIFLIRIECTCNVLKPLNAKRIKRFFS